MTPFPTPDPFKLTVKNSSLSQTTSSTIVIVTPVVSLGSIEIGDTSSMVKSVPDVAVNPDACRSVKWVKSFPAAIYKNYITIIDYMRLYECI